jgi:transcriptional regulator with XRE-family HTH domain
MSLGKRLREVRKEMDLSQTEFAEIGGVLRNSQGLYERGKRSPDTAYLEKIAAAGADVVYILTGVRAPELTPPPSPPPTPLPLMPMPVSLEEKALLDNFRECEKADQNAIRRLVRRSAEARHLKTRARPGDPPEAQETQAAL